MEADLGQIARGEKGRAEVIRDCLLSMLDLFRRTVAERERIVAVFRELMGEPFQQPGGGPRGGPGGPGNGRPGGYTGGGGRTTSGHGDGNNGNVQQYEESKQIQRDRRGWGDNG